MNDRLPPAPPPTVTVAVRQPSGEVEHQVDLPEVMGPAEALQAAQRLMDASDQATFAWPTPMRRNGLRRSVVAAGRTHGNRVEVARYILDCLSSVSPDTPKSLEKRILEVFRCIIHLGPPELQITDPTALWAEAMNEVARETIRDELEEEAKP